MATTHRAPKQWSLSKNETVNSFENWKHNLQYTLSLDPNFAPFLIDNFTWDKKTKASPLRGFIDDDDQVPAAKRRTAQQKMSMLELMLGQIANYCPVISRSTIVKNSTSITNIWQAIRLHFGFQSTGGHILDFASIHLNADERPEDLYQRLTAFVEDNLLRRDSGISHHGQVINEDEELSPSLENYIVLTWLRLIHSGLPRLVKQRYGTELRSRTLASIKPEISQALESLLEELHTSDSTRSMRTSTSKPQWPRQTTPSTTPHSQTPFRPKPARATKTCPLCKQVGRNDYRHFLSECPHLPDPDRKYIARARQVANILDESDDEPTELACALVDERIDNQLSSESSTTLRVQVRQSPYIDTFHDHHTVRVTIDSGATGNMIRENTAKRLNSKIRKSSQSAHQADGCSPLVVIGETDFTLTRDGSEFRFEGLVVENLDVEILAGTPFMETNDIAIRPAKRQVILGDGTTYTYGSTKEPKGRHTVRRADVLRAPSHTTTVWPGEFIELELPPNSLNDTMLALEPRTYTHARDTSHANLWPPPALIQSVAGRVRIPNLTDEPLVLKRKEQFCQVSPVFLPLSDNLHADSHEQDTTGAPKTPCPSARHITHSASITLDPNNMLNSDMQSRFRGLHEEYDEVFDPTFPGYNDAAGPFEAVVNMGPVQPPQRKGRLPQYAQDKLRELQHKFDELEKQGVFARPEDMGVNVEYLNPSFLIKKPNGGFRLVTAFADVGRYSKPQPSLMPDVDSTLRKIAQWKYLIATDLTSAFYQIPLSRQSMKYCGVATPFRGVRVYTRSAMGMPGSETALEELMCRILGDHLEKGIVAKLADDLYCGGNTLDELLNNWRSVLHAMYKSRLRLSASKTVVCPKSTTILGWIWSNGTIQASPHRIATLSTCTIPDKVGGLRSFIGAFKVLSRVVPECSSLMSPLDDAAAGRQTKDKLTWSDDLRAAFRKAQSALTSAKTITLPRPDDQLWIVTDGSVKKHSIGSTLYITRNDKPLLAGFFSAKLRGRQPTWLPCEVEALSISASTKHFSPLIIQSKHHACILTDSKPCVQAFEKLCRGEFSASPRVSTFLSTVSRYQASVRHLAGSANIPSDFASRNAPTCHDSTCQICAFVKHEEDSVVLRISAEDVISGNTKLPFTSRAAWAEVQSECADLRRTHAHLVQGTRPSKKLTNIKDVKRYLHVASVAKDGLLIVRRDQPLSPTRECIIVPRQVLTGLLTALHIQLSHPTRHQLHTVTNRYFYALDMDKAIEQVTTSCHHCASLRTTPHTVIEQSTGDPPETIGVSFSADVIKRNRQLILVVRENTTSFTASCHVDSERHDTLRDALIRLCIELRPLDGPPAVIRTDPAPGFTRLVRDDFLKQHHMSIEVGRIKNPNKNPVAEKAVRELEEELLRLDPMGGTTTPLALSLATANLNSRIRTRGLSAREMWHQRDQFTNQQIPFSDLQMIQSQHQLRTTNHPYSERSKAPLRPAAPTPQLEVGDLVYLYSDRDKTRARDRYLVSSVEGAWCNIRKFRGSQLRSASYRVKKSECYRVPSHWEHTSMHRMPPPPDDTAHEDDDIYLQPAPRPPDPPHIPTELSTPADDSSDIVPITEEFTPHSAMGSSETPTPVTDEEPPTPAQPCSTVPTHRRSSRQRSLPKHLKDFVLDY